MRGEIVRVRGIAWNVHRSQRGHTYFRLRHGRYALSCAVFRPLSRELPFRIQNGQELTLEGHVELAGWSELRIVAHDVTLVQSAPTHETLSVLKARAQAEGWLDPRRKRPLPHPLECIGLITGESSRANRDVTGSLHDAGVEAMVIPQYVLLSGPEVAQQVRLALGSLNARPEIDLIVIARGGTSHDPDLVAFNDWALAEAIVGSRALVLTAIGHRQDRSLADLVADRSVPTPSSVGQALARAHQPLRSQELAAMLVFVLVLIVLLFVLARTLGWIY
jgi:exodeoxyribonuclease VII large subunit